MDPPVRRCPGCHLKVHTPVKMEDGRSYCESCAERINEELAAPGDAPHDAEPEARMPDDHSMSNGMDSNGEAMLRVVPTPERVAPPPPAPAPAPAPVATSTPEQAAPPRPVAKSSDSALDGTLENLLERERDRLHEHRAEVEARIRRAEAELDAIAERLEHIGGLLTEPVYEEARAV